MPQILIVLAGLMGAAGIMLAAAAAHSKPGLDLESASQMLILHAAAVVAICAAIAQGLVARPVALVGGWHHLDGHALFGDRLCRGHGRQWGVEPQAGGVRGDGCSGLAGRCAGNALCWVGYDRPIQSVEEQL